MSVPITAPDWRPLLCPVCARYLGTTDHTSGSINVHCRTCRAYRVIDLSDASTKRHGDADRPVRLIRERGIVRE